jgi:hypothetical protein
MNVITHQAVGVYRAIEFRRAPFQFREINLEVAVRAKARRAVIAALDDVHRDVRDDEARLARHRTKNDAVHAPLTKIGA